MSDIDPQKANVYVRAVQLIQSFQKDEAELNGDPDFEPPMPAEWIVHSVIEANRRGVESQLARNKQDLIELKAKADRYDWLTGNPNTRQGVQLSGGARELNKNSLQSLMTFRFWCSVDELNVAIDREIKLLQEQLAAIQHNALQKDRTLEFWNGERKITLYLDSCDGDPPLLLKVWGSNILHEMESVLLSDSDAVRAAFDWLYYRTVKN